MSDYLRRLATTGAAYTAASVLSKLIAVFLLPLYTAYLTPADYGAAEVMLAAVVAGSIVIRFRVIEAILRFYYLAGEQPRRVVATGFASLFWTATAGAVVGVVGVARVVGMGTESATREAMGGAAGEAAGAALRNSPQYLHLTATALMVSPQ